MNVDRRPTPVVMVGLTLALTAASEAPSVSAQRAAQQTHLPPSSPSKEPCMSLATPTKPDFEKGRSDFDFYVGDWQVENRRMTRPLQEDSPWETFHAISHMEKLPGGIGNFDTFQASEWRPGWMGMSLRLFNGETGLWSIYWLNSKSGGIDSATGQLAPPVVGRFENGVGIFEGDDVLEGRPLRVRYTWRVIDADQATWQQAFSLDRGATWKTNWTMKHTRARRTQWRAA